MGDKKRLLLILILFIVLIMGGKFGYDYLKTIYNKDSGNNTVQKEDKASDFIVYDGEGKEVKLSDYIDKTNVVLNFWASWCPPCKSEMVHFQSATDKYKDEDIVILMVNVTDGSRETVDKAKSYLESSGYNMKVVFDKDLDAATKNNISGIPRTIFIKKGGTIVKDKLGVVSENELFGSIEDLIKNN